MVLLPVLFEIIETPKHSQVEAARESKGFVVALEQARHVAILAALCLWGGGGGGGSGSFVQPGCRWVTFWKSHFGSWLLPAIRFLSFLAF